MARITLRKSASDSHGLSLVTKTNCTASLVDPQGRPLSARCGQVLEGFENTRFVYFMGENQSFMRWHGALVELFPQMNGVVEGLYNDDLTGTKRFHLSPATERLPMYGPEHSMSDTAQQMSRYAMGDMLGFVANFQRNYPHATDADLQDIMSYMPFGSLPFDHGAARFGTTFDRWHADVPGPTWPNRTMPFAGQTGSRVNMAPGLRNRDQWLKEDLPLIFDLLNQAGISWAYFYGDIPLSLILKRMRLAENASHLYPMEMFFQLMAGPAENIPQVIICEPTWYPPHNGQGDQPNSDLWPADPLAGQLILKRIYEALRASAVWDDVVFVSTKDEHGGYFDSVYPPSAMPIAAPGPFGEYGFNQLGIRVPTQVFSPRVKPGLVQEVYSASSFTKTLSEVFGLPFLTDRVAEARSLLPLIDMKSAPRSDFPMTVDVSHAVMLPIGGPAQAKQQQSFMGDFHREASEILGHLAEVDGPRWYGDLARAWQRFRTELKGKRHGGVVPDSQVRSRYLKLVDRVGPFADRARNKVA